MRLQIGAFERPNNEAVASITIQPQWDKARRLVSILERWDISGRVVLKVASQSAMTQELLRVEAAFSQTRPNLIFREDVTGAQTKLVLLAANCIRGPELVDFGYPNQANDVYATGMAYRGVFEAERPGLVGQGLLEFEETVEEEPGGVELVWVGGAINLAERQVGRQAKTWRYVQQGRAVGLYGYPAIPPAIWPFALLRSTPQITRTSPRKLGQVDTEFGISWRWEFEWGQRLFGLPHRAVF